MPSPRFFDRPPRITSIVAILWVAAFLVAHSDAGVPFPSWIVLIGSGALLAIWWALRLAIALFRERDLVRRHLRTWLIVPAALLVAFWAITTSVLIKARLYLGGDALIRAAPALAAAGDQDLWFHPRWVGLYRVRQFSAFGNELRFLTNECGLVDNCGFVYSPSGPPPNRGEDTFFHLYGNWWHWYQSW